MKMIIPSIVMTLVLSLLSCSVIGSETEDRTVSSFSHLKASGLAEVFITQTNEESVKVTVSGMPISDVITRVEDNTLIVTTQGFHSGESVKVFVNFIQLESITTGGSAEISGTNQLSGNTLLLSINDAGNADLNIDVDSVMIEMNDAGDLSLQGIARNQKVTSRGSRGTLDNGDLRESK